MAALELSDAHVARLRTWMWLAFCGALILGLALVPWVSRNISFWFYLMLWISMASAFNIISGFAGYLPFGYVAFYGIGAYVTAILVRKLDWPLALAIPLAGVAGVLLSLLFAKTLKLSGIYFAIVSLALGIICQILISNLPEEITGGSYGINLGGSPEPMHSFYAMLAVLAGALASRRGVESHPRRRRGGGLPGRRCAARKALRLDAGGALSLALRRSRGL